MENNTSKMLMILTGVVVLFLLFEVMTNTNKVNQLDLPKPVTAPSPLPPPPSIPPPVQEHTPGGNITINLSNSRSNNKNSPSTPAPVYIPVPAPAPAPATLVPIITVNPTFTGGIGGTGGTPNGNGGGTPNGNGGGG